MIRFLFLLSVMFSLSYLAYFFYQVESLRVLAYIFVTQAFFMVFVLKRPTVKQLMREAVAKKERQVQETVDETTEINPWTKHATGAAARFAAGYAIATAAHKWNNRDKT